MTSQFEGFWRRLAQLATGMSVFISAATIEAAQTVPPFEHASVPAVAPPPSRFPVSSMERAGYTVSDQDPTDWIQAAAFDSDDVPEVLMTEFADPLSIPQVPAKLTLEERLLELEMRLAEQQQENELFRDRLGLTSSESLYGTVQSVSSVEDILNQDTTAPDQGAAFVTEKKVKEKEKEKQWYEKMKVRGYVQFRYNRLGETNPNLVNLQGDQSIGDNRSFLLRRARMVFSGDINDHLSFYIQPDFASGAGGPNFNHFLQIRDFYADIFLDSEKESRIRVGQSKVPYGFENLQSSQNRIAFDRADPLNSGVVNERDLGVMYYWAPAEIRERLKYLVDSGLKGSGDYGVFGFGVYNGQTANRQEINDGLHMVSRLTYPFQFANGQIFEPGISGYTGTYNITRSAGIGGGDEFVDRRAAVSFVLYPQPLGLQGEYTWGEGPELNDANTTVVSGALEGGYLQVFYKIDNVGLNEHKGTAIPYARAQRYDGGRKHETNSPNYQIREAEVGCEYQFSKALELTMAYTWSERTFPVIPHPQEKGQLIRMQLQWNY